MKPFARIGAAVAFAIVAASGPAACGGGQGQASAPSPSIKVGLVQAQDFVHAMPARVAEQQGFFKAQGLNVSVVGFNAGSDLSKAMIGGSVDVGAATGLDAVSAAAHGVDIQAFYGVMAKSPMALIVPQNSTITGFAGLSGKKVGISKAGSLTDYIVRAAVTATGGSIDKVTEVPLGDPASMMAAMKRGDVDAFILPVNFGFIEAAKHEGKIAQKASDVLGPNSQFAILMAKKSYISGNQANLRKLTKAYTAALQWMKANRKQTIDLAVAKMGMTKPIAQQTYDALVGDFTPDGTLDRAGLADYAKALPKLGIATTSPNEDAYLSNLIVTVK
jgi:NitT/TauT family transport system substrate-binding protein